MWLQIKRKFSKVINPEFTPWVIALVILLLGLGASAFLWRNAQQQQRVELSAEFENEADRTTSIISNRLDAYANVMRGVKGFIDGSEKVTIEEFDAYIKALKIDEKKSGVQGIGLVKIVPHADKARHIAEIQSLGLSNYTIWPAGDRASYAPIVLMEPMRAANLKVLGFDTLMVPEARIAMDASRDTGDVAITSHLNLDQDARKLNEFSFIMFLPIYKQGELQHTQQARRRSISAWVDVPFRINDVIAGLKSEFVPDIDFEVHDGVVLSWQSYMYDFDGVPAKSRLADGLLQTSRKIDFAGRSWTLLFNTTSAFEARVSEPSRPSIIAGIGCVLSLVSAMLAWILARGRQVAKLTYQKLFRQAGEGVLMVRRDHRFIDVNPAALAMFGYTAEEFLSLSIANVVSNDEIERLKPTIQSLMEGAPHLGEWKLKRKDGSVFMVAADVRMLDHKSYFAILRDLTESKKAAQRILQLNNLYQALSETNQAIVRMSDETELFPLVCKSAVTFGSMQMAWVGQYDQASDLILPVASFGNGLDFLQGLKIFASPDNGADDADGCGPTAIGFRENRPVIINNYLVDDTTRSWHAKAEKFGWQAAAAFPILRNAKPYAMFAMYSADPHAFDKDVVALLTEMAMDISFSLDNFDREAERQLAQNQLQLSQVALTASRDRYLDLYEFAPVGYLCINQHGVMSEANWKLATIFGMKRNLINNHPLLELVVDEEKYRWQQLFLEMQHQNEGQELNFDMKFKHENGSHITASLNCLRVRDDADFSMLRVALIDVTNLHLAELEVRIAATAFESQEGMMVTDVNKVILKVNTAFTKISGYTAEESVGQTPRLLSSGHHQADFYDAMWKSVAESGGWEGEVWNRRKNGEIYPQHLTITAVIGANAVVTNYVATFSDVTLRHAAEAEINHLAFYDTLTGLANRRLLIDRLNHALSTCARLGKGGALLFLDLDHFKMLNDTLGHDVGDILLRQVSERLSACVRECDTVARMGGDEFVVMLEDLSANAREAEAQTELIANKILRILNQPYELANNIYQSTVSIGVVLFSDNQRFQEDLLKHADIAMYQAKKSGRNALRFFDPQMQESINSRASLENDLRTAVENAEFQLYYQIQVDDAGRALGAEALIRWVHAERGFVSPLNFIALAEETGLILGIGQWVLETACAQIKAWQLDAVTQDLTLSINVSAKQFYQVDFAARVQDALQRYDVNPKLLKLELTESMLLDHIEDTIVIMNTLKDIGIRFSLDDFGTGYSSLQYLKLLPLDQLKIDQSFVRDIGVDSSDQAIVHTIIAMAKALNLDVIAEGVETEVQREFLLACGCHAYQGYLFSKPVVREQFEVLLK